MQPIPQPLASLEESLHGDIDLFICSASFEDRCLTIAENLDCDRIQRAIVVENRRFSDIVEQNLAKLKHKFSGRFHQVQVDSDDPVYTTRNIVSAIGKKTSDVARRILIDITTFTHEALLILFYVCDLYLHRSSKVDFVYASASEYSLGDDYDRKWLSKGTIEVRSVMGFPGYFAPSRGTHLIVLAGFEHYRTLDLIWDLEPSVVSIGYGDSSEVSTKPHQQTNEDRVQKVQNILQNILGNVQSFIFSCYDPMSAELAIQDVVQKYPQCNTVIAPMNTKISTLGAGRLALKRQSIQICYAQADIYNYRGYSTPGSQYYLYRFSNYPSGTSRV